MSNALSAKQKTPAIRADPEQTALLKAAYAVSYNPSLQTVQELTQQTGLPRRWISNWFGRQRSKSRKAGEVIDMTASSSVSTNTTHPSTSEIMTFKTEYRETLMESEPPSSPLRSAIQEPTSTPRPIKPKAKATRRRATRGKPGPKISRVVVKSEHQDIQVPLASVSSATAKRLRAHPPQLLPPAAQIQSQEARMQSRFPVPPPTRSRKPPEPQTESIYPQNSLGRLTTAPMTSTFSSTGQFSGGSLNRPPMALPYRPSGPLMRTNKFRHSMPNDYFSDPVSAEAASPYQKDLDLESQRASSPASSEIRGPGSTHTQAAMNFAALCETPFASAAQEVLSGAARNLPTQALAAYMALNNDPTVFRAMLLNYATLFPTLLPALTGLAATSPYAVVSGVPDIPAPALSPPPTDALNSVDLDIPHPGESLQVFSMSGGRLDELQGHSDDYPVTKKENNWNADSNYLDLSGLHYDYAPLSHLQERLEPFRLPESEYLFGREGVVNHLLDERLAIEEPFQAAMGLVLLSKLGLEW
ncbi:hypothetical protein P691DRAFT_771877 [Macrolepiota fuliginosa MF-IS2]|uniref:Homeobox domain-containing protein n=1 Tax=Macrolepiota fuliginosa MF-IS2 TaxID=1400762 RepID=A0A9P6C8I3_9AGAR|nr:hypothetical protein P691DRAFT_771877 [Macrolepiota fuliginosa MF-IS2]